MIAENGTTASEAPVTKKRRATLSDGIAGIGEYLFGVLLYLLGLLKLLMVGIGKMALRLGGLVLKGLKYIGRVIISPFGRIVKAVKLDKAEIKSAREKGFFSGAAAVFKVIKRVLFGKRGVAVTLCNWLLPIISCVFLFNIVTYATSMSYALKLYVNGDFVGYINDETVFTDAEKIVQQRINYMEANTEVVTFEPSYEVEMVGYNAMLTQYQLADKLLASVSDQVEYAYGLYIGSSFYGAVVDKEPIEATLKSLLDAYRTENPSERIAFESKITFEPGLYLSESVVPESRIIRTITSKRKTSSYYTIVEDDSPWVISQKLGMSIEEIAALNPGFSEDSACHIGDKLMITAEEPFLAISVTRIETYEVVLPYETVYYEDNTRYAGDYIITQTGANGTEQITASVSYVNGVEIRRNIVSRTTTLQPVKELIAQGTKPRPPSASIGSTVTAGQMIWPVGGPDGGEISEMPYGYGGYPGHSGVDIRAAFGTPIYAADSGKVIQSGWYYDYGYCVQIQHANGLVTVYGHCSTLFVSAGEYVTMGDCIAAVGSTGKATGNHLHFEVRTASGSKLYPLDFLPWHKRSPWCVEY